jgi:hypothetical protein
MNQFLAPVPFFTRVFQLPLSAIGRKPSELSISSPSFSDGNSDFRSGGDGFFSVVLEMECCCWSCSKFFSHLTTSRFSEIQFERSSLNQNTKDSLNVVNTTKGAGMRHRSSVIKDRFCAMAFCLPQQSKGPSTWHLQRQYGPGSGRCEKRLFS